MPCQMELLTGSIAVTVPVRAGERDEMEGCSMHASSLYILQQPCHDKIADVFERGWDRRGDAKYICKELASSSSSIPYVRIA